MDFSSYTLAKDKAADWAKYVQNMSDYDFVGLQQRWVTYSEEPPQSDFLGAITFPQDYLDLRRILVGIFTDIKKKEKGRQADYKIDVEVGIALYDFLQKQGFTVVMAETDDWWRFISVRLCPDITYRRYPEDAAERINSKRFFAHTRRIWLKTLWWYVHLSWQGSSDATREILGKFGADAIGQLIERSRAGYRADVTRELMKRYAEESSWCDTKGFKRAMALHLIKVNSIEPTLVEDGVSGYSRNLFEEVHLNK